MKILFVYSLSDTMSDNKPLHSFEQINFGISYISSILKKHGHETRLIVMGSERGAVGTSILFNRIIEFQPIIVCFSSVATQYPFIVTIAEKVRHKFDNIMLVAGGAHASLNPEEVIHGPFDAVCIGEGEYPMLELVEHLESGNKPTNISNFWFKISKSVQKNATRPFIANLNELPFPDRDIWLEWIQENNDSRFSVLLGRGCPFECSYCCNHVFSKQAEGKYVRFRSPENILAEIKSLHEQFPEKREIFFEVETFNLIHEWFLELCRQLKDFNDTLKVRMTFGTNMRITSRANYDELFSHCVEAGIVKFTVGLESGCERVRREVMRRHYSNADVLRMAESARKHACSFGFQNMIGLPTETEQEFLETVALNRACQPDWSYLHIFFPYPGTDLANLCKKMGLLNHLVDIRQERSRVVLSLPTFPRARIKRRYVQFSFDVYRGKKPLYKILLRIVHDLCKSNQTINKLIYGIMRFNFFRKIRNWLLG